MEIRKKFHPPIIVFCPKCYMPIFPTLDPNNLLVLINGSKLSCSRCKSEFDVSIEFTERDAQQRTAPDLAAIELLRTIKDMLYDENYDSDDITRKIDAVLKTAAGG